MSDEWIYYIRIFINEYLTYVKWKIDLKRTLKYLSEIKDKYSNTFYRKKAYQIRKFLLFLGVECAKKISLPSETVYFPKRISINDIQNTMIYFKDNQYFKQKKALILLGGSSGMRAEELYQLTINDIDLDNRVVHINHNPSNGQSTKTKISRISFFNKDAKDALYEYLTYFQYDVDLMHYNYQSEEDLKNIYDRVMNSNLFDEK